MIDQGEAREQLWEILGLLLDGTHEHKDASVDREWLSKNEAYGVDDDQPDYFYRCASLWINDDSAQLTIFRDGDEPTFDCELEGQQLINFLMLAKLGLIKTSEEIEQ